MNTRKNKIVNAIDMVSSNLSLQTSISISHDNMIDTFNNINLLYGESSVAEDIILNSFLSTYNAAKSITNKNTNNVVVESFLSKDYFDKEFPLDSALNIDIQNGDLTLPIISTTDLKLSSIIIENESNGYVSNINNNKISSILLGDSSSLFIYEKISNSLSMSDLYLTLTLKTDQLDIANELYIQLYADNNTKYPVIDMVEYSENGEVWNTASYSYDTNKADHYIRFSPEYTSYIRVRFVQSTYADAQTGFGTRYKYSIGIRQITLKKTVYGLSGEYITVPLLNNKAISTVYFTSKEVGDVKYFISANNGTKLIPIKSGDVLEIFNSKMGVRDDTDIDSIRVKILLDKSNVALSTKTMREFLQLSSTGEYYTNNKPLGLRAFVGKHISFGGISPYIIDAKDVNQIDQTILEIEDGVYATVDLYYVPYYETIFNDLVLVSNNSKVKPLKTIYDIAPHPNGKHSILQIKNKSLTNNTPILSVYFKALESRTITTNLPTQEIVLPMDPFIKTKDGFNISKEVNGTIEELSQSDFELIELDSKTMIYINEKAFSNSSSVKYLVSYYPLIDISEYIPEDISDNKILMNGIKEARELQLCFEYNFENENDTYKKQFYTQVCNEFRVELQ